MNDPDSGRTLGDKGWKIAGIALLLLFSLGGLLSIFMDIPGFPSRAGIRAQQQQQAEQLMALYNRARHSQRVKFPRESHEELSAEALLERSIRLLSEGRQWEAEQLIAEGIKRHARDENIQFARGVLDRSRWSNREADLWFHLVQRTGRTPALARAAQLSRELDKGRHSERYLDELIALADENPDHVYLLWLSAIQCREQKNGELGRRQYERLLEKFTVGPVMLHQTYANILTEYLKEYDLALHHRYLAVALEAKSWTLQGLANTLTDMESYDLANAIWAKAVQLNSGNPDYWHRWGYVLKNLGRYEEAVEKYLYALRLSPNSQIAMNEVGYCFEQLGRYEEMMQYYERSAEAGNLWILRKMGDLYAKGNGVERDPHKAIELYRSVLEQDSENDLAMNNLAWTLITDADPSVHDYPEALRLAKRSVELDEQWYSLNTLAFAYNANGMYEEAIATQERRIEHFRTNNPGQEPPERMMGRLLLYQENAKRAERPDPSE